MRRIILILIGFIIFSFNIINQDYIYKYSQVIDTYIKIDSLICHKVNQNNIIVFEYISKGREHKSAYLIDTINKSFKYIYNDDTLVLNNDSILYLFNKRIYSIETYETLYDMNFNAYIDIKEGVLFTISNAHCNCFGKDTNSFVLCDSLKKIHKFKNIE